jgi:hypothetical protein
MQGFAGQEAPHPAGIGEIVAPGTDVGTLDQAYQPSAL